MKQSERKLIQSLNELEDELEAIEDLLHGNETNEDLVAIYNITRATQEIVRDRIIINRLLDK